jgi:hypothetical protein
MFKVRHRAAALATVACACMLAACGDAPPEEPKDSTSADKKAMTPKLANVAGDMVAAVSAGKAASAISIHFALRAPPTVNKALPVDVAIVPHRRFTLVRVHFLGNDSLVTTAGEDFGPKTSVESETALTHQLVLLPTREGIFMVTASVETEGEDGNITRIYSIPVIVAAAAAETPPATPAAAPVNTPASN